MERKGPNMVFPQKRRKIPKKKTSGNGNPVLTNAAFFLFYFKEI